MLHSEESARSLAGLAWSRPFRPWPFWFWLACVGLLLPCVHPAGAAERVTLRNGFAVDCSRRESVGDKVRLYLQTSVPGAPHNDRDANYLEVAAGSVIQVESIPDLPSALPAVVAGSAFAVPKSLQPTVAELHEMLARAGAGHHIDTDLLASVVHAESGGQLRAVSRTGARGLMQLMPGTASALGVKDAFIAEQNVEGGTKYLDQLLTRYHDNITLTLAAYNAGPGAVDRYKGVPPFRETRLYVARVIREFNRRKLTLVAER